MSEKNKTIDFPDSFLWGASTSAYQIEGGIINDWSEWEKENAERLAERAKNYYAPWQVKKFPEMLEPSNYICGQASNSYEMAEEDIRCLKRLNVDVYRFSLEWSRVEPKKGKFDKEAINYYKDLIKKLRQEGIEPFLTFWHWTNPLWVSNNKGWENKKTVKDFLNYAEKIIDELGGEVRFFITLNEPQTYTGHSYVSGKFPPGEKSLIKANRVYKNLIKAHRELYKLLHQKLGDDIQVGMSNYLLYQSAYNFRNPFNVLLVKILDYIRGYRFIKAINKHQDFIGVQYYHHDRIKFALGGPFWIFKVENKNEKVNDVGWDLYPQGIYYVLKKLKKYQKPIYITENGTADAEDEHREEFIKEHLYYIHKAIQEGVDVRGYFYWSLLDNFEWAEGWWPKFGLFQVEEESFRRIPRKSAGVYAEICKNNQVKL